METLIATALIGCLACSSLLAAGPAASGPALFQAIRDGDTAAVRKLLTGGADLRSRNETGDTPLIAAAWQADAEMLKLLIKAGADVNAKNIAGVTPLIYGAVNETIVRELLENGADPNSASLVGSTPLMVAAMRERSYETVKALVGAGANINARRSHGFLIDSNLLSLAIEGGDRRTVELLLKRGVAFNDSKYSPLTTAALFGEREIAKQLLDAGADPNVVVDKAGHSLNAALFAGQPGIAAMLIERGADLKTPSVIGYDTPPMVFAAFNETGDPAIAKLLVLRGVDINMANDAGETALSWALKRGPDTPLVKFLRAAGAKDRPAAKTPKSIPNRPVPAEPAARAALLQESVQRAILVMERSSTAFIDSALVHKQSNCISCHQQSLAAVAMGSARIRGFELSEPDLVKMLAATRKALDLNAESDRQLVPSPDAANGVGWIALGLDALGYTADNLTDGMTRYLMAIQRENGSWRMIDRRPLMVSGPLQGTALALRALRFYPPTGRKRDAAESVKRAERWLAEATPKTHDELVFQMLGLSWAGRPPAELTQQAKSLLAEQRADGGWAQLPGLESDAWGTGLTLVALHEAAGLATTDPAYQRGVDFLLRTQFADGSWWVKSRTWPFQPHFDSMFSHGKDQWISAGGTALATMALLLTIEPPAAQSTFPSAQQLIASTASKASDPVNPAPHPKPEANSAAIDFDRDIRPILERSCTGCHSGEKAKGSFHLSTRDTALKGGQSGEAAIIPGKPDASMLLRFVQDQTEDLEMPPLDKRAKYPALTKDEIEKLITWIAGGANWPEGAILQAPAK